MASYQHNQEPDDRYTRLMGPAIKMAYLVCGDHATAEDAAQDAYLRFNEKRQDQWSADQQRNYFHKCVLNQLRSNQRSASRRWFRQVRYTQQTPQSAQAPQDVVSRDPQLKAALQKLPERQRIVVVCTYYLDHSDKQIMDLTGWPLGSIKSARSRGLSALRKELADV